MSVWDDIGNAVSSAANTVADVAEGAVRTVADAVKSAADAVEDAVEDVIESVIDWVSAKFGGIIGFVFAILGGLMIAIMKIIVRFFGDFLSIMKGLSRITAAIIRLDLPQVINSFGELAVSVIGTFVDLLRFFTGGFFVGSIVDQVNRIALKRFVENLISKSITDPDARRAARARLRMDHSDWGFPLSAQHRVFMLDTANTPLWKWHSEGFIDLYALAGVQSFRSFQVQHPRVWARWVSDQSNPQNESSWPVNRSMISSYIETQGVSHRFRFYALTPQALSDRLVLSEKKLKKMHVRVEWDWGPGFYMFKGSPPAHEIFKKEEFRFDLDGLDAYFANKGFRQGTPSEECDLIALCAFHYEKDSDGKEGYGQTAGRNLEEGAAFNASTCNQSGRTDSCCASISSLPGREGSGVIHRDVWPDYVYKYILPHEIGHYLGLCHFGHDGFQNVMFRPGSNSLLSLGLLSYYLQAEPEFTQDDAENCWRFIVGELQCCLSDKLQCKTAAAISSISTALTLEF